MLKISGWGSNYVAAVDEHATLSLLFVGNYNILSDDLSLLQLDANLIEGEPYNRLAQSKIKDE